MKKIALIILLVGLVLIPQSAMATRGSPRLLNLACDVRGPVGHTACVLSGHGFAPNEMLHLTYFLHLGRLGAGNSQVLRRDARVNVGGSFARPPMVFDHRAAYSLMVTAQSNTQRYPVRVMVEVRGGQVLSWNCGERTGAGLTPCRLQGNGFGAAEVLTLVYNVTTERPEQSPEHAAYRRHLRADPHGGFTRPPILFSLFPSYRITVYVNHGTVSTLPHIVGDVQAGAGKLGSGGS